MQALAIGLHGRQDADHLLADMDCKIDVEIQEEGKSRLRHFYWENDHWKAVDPKNPKREALGPERNLLAYGPARLGIQGELSMAEEREKIGPVYSIIQQKGNLRNIEHWLKEEILEWGNGKKTTHRAKFLRIEKVKQLLVSLMPHISKIEIEGKNVFYWEKGHKIPAHHLSAGHKSILAMIGDLLIRLFEAQPEVVDPKELKGIVLIDELETHLHPKWQKEFPRILSCAFPKVQFIASTHSVVPFMGAPEGSVFLRVTRTEKEGTKVEKLDIDVADLLPNALITSPLFDLVSIVNKQNKDFSKVRTEDDYKEIVRRQERDKRLQYPKLKGKKVPKEFLTLYGKGK